MSDVTLHLGDCLDFMRALPDGSVDAVVTDPPYGYLKHKLDRSFDEDAFFSECRRIIKKTGFYVGFGRGQAFYRWNTMLADLGFVFKEEVIWDKRHPTSPTMPLIRVHESVSIFSNGKAKIRKTKVPYVEAKGHSLEAIIGDVNRLKSALRNTTALDELLSFLKDFEKTGIVDYKKPLREVKKKHNLTVEGIKSQYSRNGHVLDAITNGHREKSIISQPSVRYTSVHPTQKPVRLMERLIALVSDPGMTIFDPFMGSGTTGLAALQTGRKFIGCEIDPDYFAIAERRIAEAQAHVPLPFGGTQC